MASTQQRVAAAPATWQKDDEHKECTLCHSKFSTFNRRHHCRQCGHVVCNTCSDRTVTLQTHDTAELLYKQRCCDQCFRRAPVAQPRTKRPEHTDPTVAAAAPAPAATSATATPPPAATPSTTTFAAAAAAADEEARKKKEAAAAAERKKEDEAIAKKAEEDAKKRALDFAALLKGVEDEEPRGRSAILESEAEVWHALLDTHTTQFDVLKSIDIRRREITAPVLALNATTGWVSSQAKLEGCVLETIQPQGQSKKAYRVSTTVDCSLSTVVGFLADVRQKEQFEPSIETSEVVSTSDSSITHVTRYRSSAFITGRDFCTKTASHAISSAEAREIIPVGPTERIVGGYVQGSIDSAAVPAHPKYVRGTVIAFGFVAVALVRDSHRYVRFVQISNVDPKGSIPAFALEKTFVDGAKKIAKMRHHMEQLERVHLAEISGAAEALELGESDPVESSLMTPSREASTVSALAEAHSMACPSDVAETMSPLRSERTRSMKSRERKLKIVAPRVAITDAKRPLLSRAVYLHTRINWRMSKSLEQCVLSDAQVDFTDRKALRISTRINCSLATFAAFLADPSSIRKYDPALDKFEVLPSPGPHCAVTYSAYKQATRLIAARDFCSVTASAFVDADESVAEKLADFQNDAKCVFIQNSADSSAKPPQKNLTRGHILAYGYVCTGEAFDSVPITVHNLCCVDPGGNIPNWVQEAAQADNCKKLARIRVLCEQMQLTNPAPIPTSTQPPVPEFESCSEVSSDEERAEPEEPSPTAPAAISGTVVFADDDKDSLAEAGEAGADNDAAEKKNDDAAAHSDDDESIAGSFASCVDADEFEAEQYRLKTFHEEEVTRVITTATDLHTSNGWDQPKQIGACKVQSLAPPEGGPKAHRVYIEIKSTLQRFQSVLANADTIRKLDPTVDTIEMLESPPFGTVIYTAYKSASRFLSSRDFCTLTAGRTLTDDEGSDMGLYTKGMHCAAYVQNSVNSTDMPEKDGYVRGIVHAFGYIAVAVPPTAKRIRVYHIARIDPCGKVPASIVDAAVGDTCKRLEELRQLCENPTFMPEPASDAASVADDESVKSSSPMRVRPAAATGPKKSPQQMIQDRGQSRVTETFVHGGWHSPHQVGKVKVEVGKVPTSLGVSVSGEIDAHRLAMEFMCTVRTFASVVESSSELRKIDPNLERVQFLPCTVDDAQIIYTTHRSSSRLFKNSDSCALTTSRMLQQVEGSDAGLYTPGIPTQCFLQSTADCDAVAIDPDYQRKRVFAAGFIALATPPHARRIRVYRIEAAAPGTYSSTKALNAAVSDSCSRLVRLRVLCEQKEAELQAGLKLLPEGETPSDMSPSASQNDVSAPPAAVPAEAVAAPPAAVPEQTAAADDEQTDAKAVETEAQEVEKKENKDEATTEETVVAEAAEEEVVVPEEGCMSAKYVMAPAKEALFKPFLDLHKSNAWKEIKVIERCLLEDIQYNPQKKAQRFSTQMACSIRSFAAFLADTEMLRKYDTTLDKFEILPSPEHCTVTYSNYKQASRLISARDFCSATAAAVFEEEEAVRRSLVGKGVVFLQNSTNSTAKPTQPKYVRGVIHCFGYLCHAVDVDAVPLKVFNIACVDAGGSLPKWVQDAAMQEQAKKLALIRRLAEEYHDKLVGTTSP